MSTLFDCLSRNNTSAAVIIPSTPAVTLSHPELHDQVLNFQSKLAAVGIHHGDRVAIGLPNTLEFVVTFLATSCQRAVAAPLNPAYKEDEFAFYLNDLSAALILLPKGASSQGGEAVRAAKKCGVAIAEVWWEGGEVRLEVEPSHQIRASKAADIAKPFENDVALILHTSGTTGRPKAVPLTHKNLYRTTVNIRETYQLKSSDRTMLVMPLFHVHGLLAGFLAPLASGGSVIVPPKFSVSEFWRDFVDHNATWYSAVPTIHQLLLKNPMPSPLPPIRFVRSCSSPLAPAVLAELEKALSAPVLEAYAMTEAAHQMTSNPLPPAAHKPGSVGVAQGTTICIKDDVGDDLETGKIGEVCVAGTNVTAGYMGVGLASPFTPDGYFRTGDQGYLDGDGYLFLTGRIKELINKGGEKISPIELDNLFSQHPEVNEAVSFAVDDEIYGQNVAVAVVLNEGSSMDKVKLQTWVETRAAKFKVPKKVYFTQTMPKTATGKVQRRQVAKAMEAMEAQEGQRLSLAPSPPLGGIVVQSPGVEVK